MACLEVGQAQPGFSGCRNVDLRVDWSVDFVGASLIEEHGSSR